MGADWVSEGVDAAPERSRVSLRVVHGIDECHHELVIDDACLLRYGFHDSIGMIGRVISLIEFAGTRAVCRSVEMSVHDQARVVVWNMVSREEYVVIPLLLTWHMLSIPWSERSAPSSVPAVELYAFVAEIELGQIFL
jgi:hypothetical protein